MKHFLWFLSGIFLLFLSSCIGDDIILDTVSATVRILNPIDTLAVGSEYQFEAMYRNNVGMEEAAPIDWQSLTADRLSITPEGLALGLEQGPASVIARVTVDDTPVADTLDLVIGENTTLSVENTRSGTVATTSSYKLTGNFTLDADGDDVILAFDETYETSDRLPGLYIYLTNNPTTTNGALEIGEVEIFEGAHSYTIPDVELNQYDYVLYFCKPFNVKVGDGKIE